MVWIIIILVSLVSCVRTGSARMSCFVSSKKKAGLLCKITIVGLKGLTRMNLSMIENTSYLMKAKARRVRSEPSSKDKIVNLFIIKVSVKY